MIGERRGAVGAAVEPFSDSLQSGGDDGVWASSLGGYGFRTSRGRVLWTAPSRGSAWSVAESGESDNIRMGSAWRTFGGFGFSMRQRCRKSAALSKSTSPFRGKPAPASPWWERAGAPWQAQTALASPPIRHSRESGEAGSRPSSRRRAASARPSIMEEKSCPRSQSSRQRAGPRRLE